MRGKGRLLAGLGMLFGLVLVGCGTSSPATQPSATSPYGSASEYLGVAPARSGDLGHPYVKGKVVVVWRDTASDYPDPPSAGEPGTISEGFDADFWDLPPAELQPKSPQEIGTIVWLDCWAVPEGSYSNGVPAYGAVCVVTVIDKPKNRIVGRKTIVVHAAMHIEVPAENGKPSPVDDPASSLLGMADAPIPEVVAYITGLPRTPLPTPTPASSTPTPASTPTASTVEARVGDTLTIASTDGELRVTLIKTKQLPAASVAGAQLHPALFGVQLTIENSGTTVYEDSIYNCVALVDSEGQSYRAEFAVTDERGDVLPGLLEAVKIAPGERRAGWMFFALKPEQEPGTLQFTADSALGPEVGEWSLR